MENAPILLTIKEYAARWRVTERTVFNWIRRGELQVLKKGRTVRIPVTPAQGAADVAGQ